MPFSQLNNNKVLWAVTMLIFNVGSRFVLTDITIEHEWILTHAVFKRLVVFCMFFVATRDIVLSVILTIAFIVLFNYLLHEQSSLCIIPGSRRCARSRSIWRGPTHPPSTGRVRRKRRGQQPAPPPPAGAEEGETKENFLASLSEDEGEDEGGVEPRDSSSSGGMAAAFLSSLAFVAI